MSEVFVARQPIFDRELAGNAYELLFRGSNNIDRALIVDHDEATSTVVLNALTEFGIDGLMDAPMSEVLATIPFPQEMVDALVERKGRKGELLDAALRCERGDFPSADLAAMHVEAMRWASESAAPLFEAQPATGVAA